MGSKQIDDLPARFQSHITLQPNFAVLTSPELDGMTSNPGLVNHSSILRMPAALQECAPSPLQIAKLVPGLCSRKFVH